MSEPVFQKSESWKMFNRIAPRYDLLNRLLSFGLDTGWRRRLARHLPQKTNLKILDIATGTADVLLFLRKDSKIGVNIQSGWGIDLADKMLEIGRRKIQAQGFQDCLRLRHGDGHQIPFEADSFDAVTMAFGIRNMADPAKVLKEIQRVLTPHGRAIILEFSLPENKILRAMHLFYLRHGVPIIGAVISGHFQAYRYLNQTIEFFPYGRDFTVLMRNAGLRPLRTIPLVFGAASIYVGEKGAGTIIEENQRG